METYKVMVKREYEIVLEIDTTPDHDWWDAFYAYILASIGEDTWKDIRFDCRVVSFSDTVMENRHKKIGVRNGN